MVFFKKNSSGFTLVELAIVITIIAIVIAGILSGQTMIQNARLISVYDDINKFTTAFNSFRDSYRAIPGDLGNLPGASFNGGGTNRNDGIIQATPAFNSGANQATESILAWQHLFIAGLNDFNPIFSASADISITNEATRNVPVSKIQGAGYLILNDGVNGASTALKINVVQFGVAAGAGQGPILSGEDALFLDTKYDDGVPNNGSVRGLDAPPVPPATTVNSCVSTISAYQVGANNVSASCLVRFLLPQ
jgi:prepilin-type N-terminal cleavage/methylation domain-containing protein